MRLLIGTLCLIVMTFSGCGAIVFHKKNVEACIDRIYKTRSGYESEYLGQSKDVLLKNFGDPTIRHNAYCHGIQYEEEWSYRTAGGWFNTPCASVVWFYIQDGIVQAVDVF